MFKNISQALLCIICIGSSNLLSIEPENRRPSINTLSDWATSRPQEYDEARKQLVAIYENFCIYTPNEGLLSSNQATIEYYSNPSIPQLVIKIILNLGLYIIEHKNAVSTSNLRIIFEEIAISLFEYEFLQHLSKHKSHLFDHYFPIMMTAMERNGYCFRKIVNPYINDNDFFMFELFKAAPGILTKNAPAYGYYSHWLAPSL